LFSMMHDSKWKAAAALVVGLVVLGFAARADAQIAPAVVQVPANAPPAVPSGMKVTCLVGPNVLVSSPTCPVVKWYGYTYWAFSFIDNRLAMGIAAYDPTGNLVALWEKPGARYVWGIGVDPAARTVTFGGQANGVVSMTWGQLSPAPVVAQVPSSSAPGVPAGMKVTCLTGPNVLVLSPTCPVVKWFGYTYWAFSYIDNRVGMGIVAFDAAGSVAAVWERSGARYVYAITVDPAARTVAFAGQVDMKITMTWSELLAPPAAAFVPNAAPPQVPAGLKVTCLQGPNVLVSSPTCPVVRWGGYTYWALSYLDNRVGMAIVAYDGAGNIAAVWEKPGARYVYGVAVDGVARTVAFAGQSDARITMPWSELTSQ
jgi:hypothetical protein